MSKPVWKDATSYSRDGDRTPTAWRLSLSSDCVITIVSRHIYYPNQWIVRCPPFFDTHPLNLEGTEGNLDEAQSLAVALVRGKVSEIASKLREIN